MESRAPPRTSERSSSRLKNSRVSPSLSRHAIRKGRKDDSSRHDEASLVSKLSNNDSLSKHSGSAISRRGNRRVREPVHGSFDLSEFSASSSLQRNKSKPPQHYFSTITKMPATTPWSDVYDDEISASQYPAEKVRCRTQCSESVDGDSGTSREQFSAILDNNLRRSRSGRSFSGNSVKKGLDIPKNQINIKSQDSARQGIVSNSKKVLESDFINEPGKLNIRVAPCKSELAAAGLAYQNVLKESGNAASAAQAVLDLLSVKRESRDDGATDMAVNKTKGFDLQHQKPTYNKKNDEERVQIPKERSSTDWILKSADLISNRKEGQNNDKTEHQKPTYISPSEKNEEERVQNPKKEPTTDWLLKSADLISNRKEGQNNDKTEHQKPTYISPNKKNEVNRFQILKEKPTTDWLLKSADLISNRKEGQNNDKTEHQKPTYKSPNKMNEEKRFQIPKEKPTTDWLMKSADLISNRKEGQNNDKTDSKMMCVQLEKENRLLAHEIGRLQSILNGEHNVKREVAEKMAAYDEHVWAHFKSKHHKYDVKIAKLEKEKVIMVGEFERIKQADARQRNNEMELLKRLSLNEAEKAYMAGEMSSMMKKLQDRTSSRCCSLFS